MVVQEMTTVILLGIASWQKTMFNIINEVE